MIEWVAFSPREYITMYTSEIVRTIRHRSNTESNRTLHRAFWLDKLTGMFPFEVDRDGCTTNQFFLIVSMINILFHVSALCFIIKEEIKNHTSTYSTHELFVLAGRLALLMTSLVHISWTILARSKLSAIFKAVASVELTTKNPPPHISTKLLMIFSSAQILAFLLEIYESQWHWDLLIYYMVDILTVLCMRQVTWMAQVIRYNFKFLSDTLDRTKVEQWTEFHELLTDCFEWLFYCYSPQLIIIFMNSFVYLVSDIYYLTTYELTDICIVLIYAYWCTVDISIWWYVISNCKEVQKEAKKFDKLLYDLVINDDSNTLLRNKRVILHFKGKHKIELSAMGLFKVDYPLLCSLISSATTYVIIMVQF